MFTPVSHKKVGRDDGVLVDALGVRFKWKVRGEDTGFSFAVYEMTLQPRASIPLHMHPFAEFFYVLQGCIELLGVDGSGARQSMSVCEGESANAAINAPHGIENRSEQPARFLSVANFQHEMVFNEYISAIQSASGAGLSEREQASLFVDVAGRYQGYLVSA